MSKRDLKKYIASLPKEELEVQMLALYEKFPDVKAYYNFVFNPREDRLEQEAKAKIANEYFPQRGKRPKLRRSVAQKFIRRFLTLGVDPFVVAEIMLFTIETAQKFSATREIRYNSFYKSILNSYKQAVEYVIANGIASDYRIRLKSVQQEAVRQRWDNREEFEYLFNNVN